MVANRILAPRSARSKGLGARVERRRHADPTGPRRLRLPMNIAHPHAIAAAIAGIFGLVIGSFVGVVADRIPRKESIVRPPSHCTSCGTPLRPMDNIPVISYLVLRGRCHSCGVRI